MSRKPRPAATPAFPPEAPATAGPRLPHHLGGEPPPGTRDEDSPGDDPAEDDAPVDEPRDLSDYRWVPVLRKRRPDGWSPEKQRAFVEALADTGSVTEAARAVQMSITSCYRLRRAPDGAAFAAAWDAALQQASGRLMDVAFERALGGVEEPVFNKQGERIGSRTRYNDRLLMFLLRAHQPDRYRHAHQSLRGPGEPSPPLPAPVADAIATLEPAPPAEPHLLMPPEELETALDVADIMDGELPHWHRDVQEEAPPVAEPFGHDFELELADSRMAASPVPEAFRMIEEDEDYW